MSDTARSAVASHRVAEHGVAGFDAMRPAERTFALEYAIKRVVDWCAAFIGGLLLSPVLAAIAVAIKFDSPGPVFFRQVRIGRDGEPFMFLKFRSMQDGNDPAIHRGYVAALIREDGEAKAGEHGSYKIEADPRVTRFGRLLRRTSLDELPQLWNVLRGEMSLVGPRPPIDYEVELYG